MYFLCIFSSFFFSKAIIGLLHEVPLWHFPPVILDHTLCLTPRQQRAEEQALTGTHGRVVAGSVLAQGSGALGGEGGGGAEAVAALPALAAGDGARAPWGPFVHLSVCQEAWVGKGRHALLDEQTEAAWIWKRHKHQHAVKPPVSPV